MPPGGGKGMKFKKPFSPITRKITPVRYLAITEAVLIPGVLLFDRAHCIDVMYIDVNLIAPTTDPGSRFRVTAGEETPAPSDYLAAPGPTSRRSRLAPPES
jgi:hypothetical protein